MDEKGGVCVPDFWCLSYLSVDTIRFPLFEFPLLLRGSAISGQQEINLVLP